MKKAAAAAMLALALLPVAPALAGYRIREADLEYPQDTTTYWFQGGRARVDGALEGLSVLVDLPAGEGWLVDFPYKRYAGGKFDALSEILKKIEGGTDAEAGEKAAKPASEPERKLAVAVKDLGPAERLQGYETRRYQVLVDGELLEELWLAPKIQVSTEIDVVAFGVAMKKMIGGGAGLNQGYEESEAYRGLRAGGYPLRQVLYFVGEKSTLEVVSVAVEEIPAREFAVPKGFTRAGYAELLLGGSE